MATLTSYNPTDPDPFMTEAKAQVLGARRRLRNAWLDLAGAAFWFTLWVLGLLPWWLTFGMALYAGVRAIYDFQGWLIARSSAAIALQFRAGIEE